MAAAMVGNKLVEMGSKIIAVGRNYAAHAKELGNAVPKEPVLFLKPTSSYVREGGAIEIPPPLQSVHHEVELAVVIGTRGRDISEESAMDHVEGSILFVDRIIFAQPWDTTIDALRGKITSCTKAFIIIGYALAIDVTARDLQAAAKASGLPWTVSKGYDTFTPISDFIPKKKVPAPDDLELWLKVDGELRQKGSSKDMIFSIPFLISHISSVMTLFEGDVILTGTPSGVGPVKAGQKITAGITGLIDMTFPVVTRQKIKA